MNLLRLWLNLLRKGESEGDRGWGGGGGGGLPPPPFLLVVFLLQGHRDLAPEPREKRNDFSFRAIVFGLVFVCLF